MKIYFLAKLSYLVNLSAIADVPSLYVEYISISIVLPWSTHILFGFVFELSKISWNKLAIVTPQ